MKIFKNFQASLILSLLFLPAVVGAVNFVPCDGTDCTPCHFVQLGNQVLVWLIGILFLVFAVMMTVAGFGLVTSGGNSQAMSAAKKMLTNALIGIMIVLAAWLTVDTVMRGLLGGNGDITGYGPWSEISCSGGQNASAQVNTYSEIEGGEDTWGTGTYNIPTQESIGKIGSGNSAIVKCAQVFDAQQCQYSQAKRNGCTGNPGYTDCSDLVSNCFQAAGCRSPGGSTATIYPNASAIGSQSTLKAGDAIVYRHGNSGHVVICMDDGCVQVIHAAGRGAPDGEPAKVPIADQIKISNSSYHLGQTGARVIRTSDFCK